MVDLCKKGKGRCLLAAEPALGIFVLSLQQGKSASVRKLAHPRLNFN